MPLFGFQGGEMFYVQRETGDRVQLGADDTWRKFPIAAVSHGDFVYVIENERLWRVDPNTGEYVQRGADHVWLHAPILMTALGDSLYVIENKRLWKVDPDTGAYTPLGSAGDWRMQPAAMAALNGSLYVIENKRLWKVNPSTGSYTPIGNANTWRIDPIAMTVCCNQLYIIENQQLFRITNLDTGQYEPLGRAGVWTVGPVAMTAVGNVLFVVENSQLYEVNATNGTYQARGAAGAWSGAGDTVCLVESQSSVLDFTNFTFDAGITQVQELRLLRGHARGYSRAMIAPAAQLSATEKANLRLAYARAIRHSVLTTPGVNGQAILGGSRLWINFGVLFPQGDNETDQTIVHEMAHCASVNYTHPARQPTDVPGDNGPYYSTVPLRAELTIAGAQSDMALVDEGGLAQEDCPTCGTNAPEMPYALRSLTSLGDSTSLFGVATARSDRKRRHTDVKRDGRESDGHDDKRARATYGSSARNR